MALIDVALKKAKPREKQYRMSDEKGFYALIRPNGAKWWRFDYVQPDGTRNTISLGAHPETSLAVAGIRTVPWCKPETISSNTRAKRKPR